MERLVSGPERGAPLPLPARCLSCAGPDLSETLLPAFPVGSTVRPAPGGGGSLLQVALLGRSVQRPAHAPRSVTAALVQRSAEEWERQLRRVQFFFV